MSPARRRPALTWTHEASPTWDADKQRVIGSAPRRAPSTCPYADGAALPGDWWAARTPDGAVVGYGWLDATWGGDAEILLAVDAVGAAAGRRVASCSAGSRTRPPPRGLNYVYNTVRDSTRSATTCTTGSRCAATAGRQPSTTRRCASGSAADDQRPAPGARTRAGRARAVRRRATTRPARASAAPGHEESGGYVDVDDHQY